VAEGEVSQALVAEVVEGALCELLIGGFGPGDAGDLAGGADVDAGEIGAEDFGGDVGVFDAGDDAVAAPAVEPAGGLAAAALVEVDVPSAVLADVGADAVEDPACVFVGGFDDECDAAAAVRGCGGA